MENEKIQALLKNHIEEVIVITDKDGYIFWVNDWFTELTEFTFNEAFGKKPGLLLQGEETDERTVKLMSDAIIAEEKFNVNVVNYSKSGKKYWLNINCFPVFNEKNEVEYFVAIERDITTEYKKNQLKLNELIEEQERLSAEKSELIELIYKLTHDLKAPLNNIKGLSQIINSKDDEVVEMLSGEVDRSVTLINKILANRSDNSNKIKLDFSDFNPLSIIKNLEKFNKMNLSKNQLWVRVNSSEEIIVKSDKVLVTQILENLFINAIKYAKSGSEIAFDLLKEENHLKITISNKTDELEDWKLSKLFKPFQNFDLQFSEQSNGMGLYIVKKYIDMINGQIQVHKIHDKVSFEVLLPKQMQYAMN